MMNTSITPDNDFGKMINYSEDDVDWQLAYDAHRGTSFTPEVRAKQEQKAYVDHLTYVQELFSQWKTEENQAAMAEDLERYRQGYLKHLTAKLQADSRTLSAFITGGARFPTRRNEKACQIAHNRLEELLAYQEKALTRLKRKYNPVAIANAPVSSDDANAIEKLQAKINKAVEHQGRMKAANKIVRKKSLSDEQKVAALVSELGFSEHSAWGVLEPDYMGRKGFAAYKLQNNSANIRRMKQRIETLKAEQDRAPAEDKQIDDGLKVVENTDLNRIQLVFDDKPPLEIRQTLNHRFGFRWAPSQKAWQRQLNSNGRRAAEMFVEWYKENK